MRAWLDFGAANTGITLGTLTRYACLLSDGTAADLATSAALDEVDSTNLPGLYILDAPGVTEEARGKAWVTATPAIWSPLHFNDVLSAVDAQTPVEGDAYAE